MAAKSKNKYDVFNWIKDEVIPSIQNYQQSLTCEKLIDNFDRMYNDNELTKELSTIRYFKYDNI
jgi:acyl CoA:acetate/3-ketoacid CoA transferase